MRGVKNTDKKTTAFLSIITLALLIAGFIVYAVKVDDKNLTINGSAKLKPSIESRDNRLPYEVHTRIIIEKEGENGREEVLNEYHAGVVTNYGLNLTFNKLFGNSTGYNATEYNYNLTHVGIGNQGTLTAASTVLPGEWNRTVADSQHDLSYNQGNWTLVIYPGSGPYTADCLGVYCHATNNCLFLYDTFNEVTGIDDTFTITLEIILQATGS